MLSLEKELGVAQCQAASSERASLVPATQVRHNRWCTAELEQTRPGMPPHRDNSYQGGEWYRVLQGQLGPRVAIDRPMLLNPHD
jgi:hypothetical protein